MAPIYQEGGNVEYKDYVIKAKTGDIKSYEHLVNVFQGMAIGYKSFIFRKEKV